MLVMLEHVGEGFEVEERTCACAGGSGARYWKREGERIVERVEGVVEDRIAIAGGSTVLYNVEN